MRRKSERTACKKAKPSPEKKEKEKVKRKSTRRRKQSSSSENESTEETVPAQPTEVIEVKADPPVTPTKQDSPEDSEDQVWQVKSAGSGDGGEIQKIKICLTRPSSTPERVERSPRSKRKHSRATSSSDTPSTEGDEKKKAKHRSKRTVELKEESEKNQESPDEAEADTPADSSKKASTSEGPKEVDATDTAVEQPQVSTTNQETKDSSETAMETEDAQPEQQADKESENEAKDKDRAVETVAEEKTSDADTTVSSPKNEGVEQDNCEASIQPSPARERSLSADQSEVLELQAEESKLCESSDMNFNESQGSEEDKTSKPENQESTVTDLVSNEVSMSESKADISEQPESNEENKVSTNMTDVVDHSQSSKPVSRENSSEEIKKATRNRNTQESSNQNDDIPDSVKDIQNGQTAPVSNRKRRWGSRTGKLTSQKSITISTDILKEIIPDVKPVEFDEVVEEKKHKRVEVPDKVDRPVLPKIVIDNTDSARNEPRSEDKENVKNKDVHLAASRKISIVKEEESIIARPPSPPRHKQSNILYITNLVRPFTLLQLKNLLQRTGRIVEDGFWIDRIKSKCYVKYELEDQAVETRHALHGVTWPVSNPKTLHVDFATQEDFDRAKVSETSDSAPVSTIPGTVEDWLREQDMKRERGEMEKPWERKIVTREWDVGKNDKDKEAGRNLEKYPKDERLHDKRRHRSHERSPEPAKKFKKKEEEAPAKLLDDLFRKTKTTPCIYWLPLSAETIAVKEEQRRQHMAEHERRMQEMRRTHRRH